MKSPIQSLAAAFAACVVSSVSFAQSSVAAWTFADVTAGTTTNIGSSSADSGLTVSLLTSSGGTNNVGVRGLTPFGATQATGSAVYGGPVFEVGMSTTSNTTTPANTDYALSFSVTVNAGSSLSVSSLGFDLGYDTDFATSNANYFAPFAQLFVSTDGTSWSAVGSAQTLAISNTAIFSTGAGSGGVHFVQTGYSLDLSSTSVSGTKLEGDTAFFRLALTDGGSASDRRRVLVDNISLNATVASIPEPSTYALVFGAAALVAVMNRRRRA